MGEKTYTLDELQRLLANLGNSISSQAMQKEQDMAKERRRVIVGWNDDHEPVYKQLFAPSQDEMNDQIVRTYIESGRINEFMSDIMVATSNETLRSYSERWIKRKRKLKPTTRANYVKYLKHINEKLGDLKLSDISVEDVQDLLDSNSEMAHKSLKDMKNILHQILRYAISDGLIKKNPCDSADIEIPSDKVNTREALPIDQFRDILLSIPKLRKMDQRYLGLIMYTGMRRGEALGVKWEDIDFEKQEIHICRNVTHPQQNQPVVSTPKTKAGFRTIPLDENLAIILRPALVSGYILGGDVPLTLSGFRAMMKRIKENVDLHGATAHILRHSYLTYAVGETTDFKTVQGISGHADVGTLINRYAHPQEDKKKNLMAKMHQRLSV